MSDSTRSAPEDVTQVVVNTSGLPKETQFFVAVRTRRRGHAHKYRVTYHEEVGWYIETGGFYENLRRTRNWVGSVGIDGVLTASSGDSRNVVEEIVKNTAVCCIRYARSTGRCIVCRLLLENRKSVRLGIGPVCREKHSWVLALNPGNLSDESSTDAEGSLSEAVGPMDNFINDDSSEGYEDRAPHRRLTRALSDSGSSSSSTSLEALLDDAKDMPQHSPPHRPHKKCTVEIRLSISGWSDDDGYDIHVRRVRRARQPKRRLVDTSDSDSEDDDQPVKKRVREIFVNTE